MSIFKRIYYSLFAPKKVILIDYPADPVPVYTREHPHKKLFEIISANDRGYQQLLANSLSFKKNISSIKNANDEKDLTQPTWNNNFVPGLDIIILYTLLEQLKPARYIEIGSGTSTKTAYKARKDHQLNFTITCIDPHPSRRSGPLQMNGDRIICRMNRWKYLKG
jgi:hypothetical protein